MQVRAGVSIQASARKGAPKSDTKASLLPTPHRLTKHQPTGACRSSPPRPGPCSAREATHHAIQAPFAPVLEAASVQQSASVARLGTGMRFRRFAVSLSCNLVLPWLLALPRQGSRHLLVAQNETGIRRKDRVHHDHDLLSDVLLQPAHPP